MVTAVNEPGLKRCKRLLLYSRTKRVLFGRKKISCGPLSVVGVFDATPEMPAMTLKVPFQYAVGHTVLY